MLDVVAHALLAALTALAWLGLGSLVVARLPPVEDRLLDLLNRFGVGAIAFGLLTFGAGWTRLLYSTPYRVVFAVAALLGLLTARHLSTGLRLPAMQAWSLWEKSLLGLLTVFVCLCVLATAAPVSSPDAVLYHAADPALFEKAHRIFEVPWNSSSYEPFTVEMQVLDGILLWNPVQGAFAPFLLGLLALAAVMGLALRLAGRSAALLAGAIFFVQPFIAWETTSTFVEPGLAAAMALSSWNLLRFFEGRERGALVQAGIFSGGAAGMKYLGLICALALVVAGLVLLWRRLGLGDVASFAIPALLVAAPWYVKNAILTGNPFYPHLFGGLNPAAATELARSMRDFGDGRSLFDLFALPVHLLGNGESFDGGDLISPLLLAFAPLALLLRRRRRTTWAVAVGVIVFVLGWFVTTQQARFLLPLMPIAAVLGALGVLALAATGRLGRLVAVAATSTGLLGALGVSSVYAAQFAPVVLAGQPEQEFLTEKVSNYEAVTWLNHHLAVDDTVAVDIWALLYLESQYVTFGTMGDLLPPDAGPGKTRAFVRKYGVTYFAVLERDRARRQQVEAIGARIVARVPVRSVRSRTRSSFGPRQNLLVYSVMDSAQGEAIRRRPHPRDRMSA